MDEKQQLAICNISYTHTIMRMRMCANVTHDRTCQSGMEYVFNSCVHGHHVSKDFWSPFIGEELSCERKDGNPHDPYAVAAKKGQLIVGHISRKISAALFLLRGNGTITSTIMQGTGNFLKIYPKEVYIEVPCVLKLRGEVYKICGKLKKMLPTEDHDDGHNGRNHDEPPHNQRKGRYLLLKLW